MPKFKPTCPQCGGCNLRITSTFAIKSDCHYLERKRIAYYKCPDCKAEYVLTTPQGSLEAIKTGVVTRDMAIRVLKALDMSTELAQRLK